MIKGILTLLFFTVFAIVVFNLKRSQVRARGGTWLPGWVAVLLFVVGIMLWYIVYYLIVGHGQ